MASAALYCVVLVCLLGTAAAQTWTATGNLNSARDRHTATLLPNGLVLVACGLGDTGVLDSGEVFNPSTGVWTVTDNLNTARDRHTATLLPNERAGGGWRWKH